MSPVTELWQASDVELVDAVTADETQARQQYHRQLQRLSELDRRGVAVNLGYSSTVALLMHTLRISRREARHRLAQAAELFPGTTPTGAGIEASLPQTAEALARGEVGVEQIDVISRTLKDLPVDLEPEKRVLAEAELLKQAACDEPAALARFGSRVRDMLDPDGRAPRDPDPRPARELRRRMRNDGSMDATLHVDAEYAHQLDAMLTAREKLRDSNDNRSYPERAGDAFVEILKLAANCPDLPTHNGLKTEVALVVNLDTIQNAHGDTVLDVGDTYMTARDVRRILCDAHILPAVMGGDSKPLDVAVPAYVVPAHIRRGLVLRDKGCAFPGCEKPGSACDSHHVRHWLGDGPTQLDNLVLLCPQHHRLVHHSEWQIRMPNGIPEFIPPSYVDPLRRPRRNAIRRPPPLPAAA